MTKAPQVVRLTPAALEELLAKLRAHLDASTYELAAGCLQTLAWLLEELEQKNTALGRLRRMLFGASTERTQQVFPPQPGSGSADATSGSTDSKVKRKRKGHGRLGAQQYSGAKQVVVAHPTLKIGELCPACLQSTLYELKQAARMVCIAAQPFFPATLYLLQRLRCKLCGQVFTAPAPAEAFPGKYDPKAGFLLGLLRYGTGLPMYRIEKAQMDFGVPLPASTQWELMAQAAQPLEPVYQALLTYAAQAHLLHNDDTRMRVQSLRQEIAQKEGERTGIFTTSIVAHIGSHQVALFFTGGRHAGENLDQLLQRRAAQLAPPIQMCDALSCNPSKEFQVLLAHCLPHGRRQFVEIAAHFPEECRRVLESLAHVFHNEAQAKEARLSPQERLVFHQERSVPVMESLQGWMQGQLEHQQVEPNSGLGQALQYMLRHWPELTLFLRQPGAPLDNNICERALKMAILHRKNSLSYKTQNGARIGDLFMSLIQTCRLNAINPFDYLCALGRHARPVAQHPEQWLPWIYRQTVEASDTG